MPVHLTKEGFLNTLSEEEAKTEDGELVITSFEEWEQRGRTHVEILDGMRRPILGG